MSVSSRGEGRATFPPPRRGRLRRALAGLVLAGAGAILCWQSGLLGKARAPALRPEAPAWFADVTDEAGLAFVQDPGPTGSFFFPQITGSGAALLDFDQDGRLDVYLLQGAGPDSPARNRLFRQDRDGHFTDVSAGSGLDVAGYCTGVAVGDVNNDGWPDVLVAQYGGLRLFLNNKGDGTFTDVSRESGLETARWATSAAFFDYDRDGWLDLVVAHYVDWDPNVHCHAHSGEREFCGPSGFPGSVTQLYHNTGKAGPAAAGKPPRVRFEDVTDRSGLASRKGPGLGVVCLDFDGDGWPDILVANDGKPNHLWVNRHGGTFKEEAVQRGLAYNAMGKADANMGIAVGDADGDGLFDVFVTHLTEETNTFWRQDPRGLFHDRTAAGGLAPANARGTGFGTVLADFDQDGWPDVAVANGRVKIGVAAVGEATLGPFWSRYAEYNRLFANEGKGRFRDRSASEPGLCGVPGVWRSLAVGDVDGDGAPDLLATQIAGPARLFKNVAPGRGHWLIVRAVDPALKRDAYGAEITVHAAGRRHIGWVNPGSSYQCSNDPRAHFGLGGAAGYDGIEVRWPDGSAETFPGGAADRVRVLKRGEGRR
jgi:hypothetical protein